MAPPRYVPEACDIAWLHFDPLAEHKQPGHDQAGHRPALVLSFARYKERSGMMICCPSSTRIKANPFEVKLAGNILVRAITGDNARQSAIARAELAKADLIAVPLPVLCELALVLAQGYKTPPTEIAEAIRRLINAANVTTNRPAAEAALAVLNAGGDFADGIIAYEGQWLGGEVFVSFDKQAIKLIKARGGAVRLLTE